MEKEQSGFYVLIWLPPPAGPKTRELAWCLCRSCHQSLLEDARSAPLVCLPPPTKPSGIKIEPLCPAMVKLKDAAGEGWVSICCRWHFALATVIHAVSFESASWNPCFRNIHTSGQRHVSQDVRCGIVYNGEKLNACQPAIG